MENRATGDEEQWWQSQNLDPLAKAKKLRRQRQAANLTKEGSSRR